MQLLAASLVRFVSGDYSEFLKKTISYEELRFICCETLFMVEYFKLLQQFIMEQMQRDAQSLSSAVIDFHTLITFVQGCDFLKKVPRFLNKSYSLQNISLLTNTLFIYFLGHFDYKALRSLVSAYGVQLQKEIQNLLNSMDDADSKGAHSLEVSTLHNQLSLKNTVAISYMPKQIHKLLKECDRAVYSKLLERIIKFLVASRSKACRALASKDSIYLHQLVLLLPFSYKYHEFVSQARLLRPATLQLNYLELRLQLPQFPDSQYDQEIDLILGQKQPIDFQFIDSLFAHPKEDLNSSFKDGPVTRELLQQYNSGVRSRISKASDQARQQHQLIEKDQLNGVDIEKQVTHNLMTKKSKIVLNKKNLKLKPKILQQRSEIAIDRRELSYSDKMNIDGMISEVIVRQEEKDRELDRMRTVCENPILKNLRPLIKLARPNQV